VMIEAGVTRLAQLTGLDCVGVPVWQAVRPWSRALTVHQGKGLDDAEARRGAIMEAIESHHAEQWLPGSSAICCSWDSLPAALRAPTLDDFAYRRGSPDPSAAVEWVPVEPLGCHPAFHVPGDCVSLDCAAATHPGLARNSNGQAAHFAREPAVLSALLEVIERDAVAEWIAGSVVSRCGSEIDTRTLHSDVLRSIDARMAALGIGWRLYRVQALIAVPVHVAEIATHGPRVSPHEHVWGSAAAFDPEESALKALLEALQTRCSQIAGSRDTIPLSGAQAGTLRQPISLPQRSDWQGHPFDLRTSRLADLEGVVGALGGAGYPQAGFVELSPAQASAISVKVFVPGLGFEARRRRPA